MAGVALSGQGGGAGGTVSAVDVPFTGILLWTVGFLLATANFFAVLDTTITNVSVPNIAGGLAVSPAEGTGAAGTSGGRLTRMDGIVAAISSL